MISDENEKIDNNNINTWLNRSINDLSWVLEHSTSSTYYREAQQIFHDMIDLKQKLDDLEYDSDIQS